MRIVILRTNTSDFGKIGSYNVQEVGLANALISKGHQVSVLYLNRKTRRIIVDSTYEFVSYLPHRTFGLHGIFNTNLLSKYSPERLILFSDNQLWAKNVIVWCKKNNVGCIQYFGNVLSDNKHWLHQIYTKLILRRNICSYSNSINIAKTRKVQIEMERLGIHCSGVIPVGLDDTLLNQNTNPDIWMRHKLGFSDDEKILLYIGRLVDYKKPILACNILEELLQRGEKCRLVLIGHGPLCDDIHTFSQYRGIHDKIIHIERVPYNEIFKYMVSADCFINLSSIEIFGMAILEVMYYGLPVVAHVAPGPCDIIENGISGYLCNTDDPKVWVNLILCAIQNRNELGVASRLVIRKRYLWDSIADEFVALF